METHENDRKGGLHKEYYESGNIRVEANYKNGKAEGLAKGY